MLGHSMTEKEELKEQLLQELEWVKYRQKMLDKIDEKLIQMREIAKGAKKGEQNHLETQSLNAKLKNLASQVSALDNESRLKEYGEILEWALAAEK